jgi:hypothetical protein
MPSDLVNALEAAVTRLVTLVSDDEELRSSVHRLALAVARATEPMPPPGETTLPVVPQAVGIDTFERGPESAAGVGAAASSETIDAANVPLAAAEPLPELTLGRRRPSVEPAAPPSPWRLTDSSEIDLGIVESRCRLKAEGARWAATRRRLISQGAIYSAEIAPKDADIISRAKALPDCFLWMCHPSGPSPTDLTLYENVACCFDNVADVLALVRRVQDKPELLRGEFEQCLDLLAEAQSALRVAVETIGGKPDSDQWLAYRWIKLVGTENQIFVPRYMRLDDPADPTRWSDLAARIDAVDSRIQEVLNREKQRHKSLSKIRHKASQMLESPDSAEANWSAIIPIIDDLVAGGLPPSNVELRELLVPVIETLPDALDLPKNVALVFREIDRYLATVLAPDAEAPAPPSATVAEVARLLRGRSMVLIGGERRPGSYEALKNAFQLQELFWIETREHETVSKCEPYIARPEVAVVVLAIRWSSHSHGEAQSFCDKYGKPFVRLPGGYNPNQVAMQILSQCSERLAADRR